MNIDELKSNAMEFDPTKYSLAKIPEDMDPKEFMVRVKREMDLAMKRLLKELAEPKEQIRNAQKLDADEESK